MVLDKIVIQAYEPTSANVLWLKPTKNGVVMYTPDGGSWRPLEIMNNMGTATISDDKVSDISNLDNTIQETVTTVVGETIGDSIQETVQEAVENIMDNQEYAEDADVEDLFHEEGE